MNRRSSALLVMTYRHMTLMTSRQQPQHVMSTAPTAGRQPGTTQGQLQWHNIISTKPKDIDKLSTSGNHIYRFYVRIASGQSVAEPRNGGPPEWRTQILVLSIQQHARRNPWRRLGRRCRQQQRLSGGKMFCGSAAHHARHGEASITVTVRRLASLFSYGQSLTLHRIVMLEYLHQLRCCSLMITHTKELISC